MAAGIARMRGYARIAPDDAGNLSKRNEGAVPLSMVRSSVEKGPMPGHDPERMTMEAIMRRWPATIRVVLRHRLLCVGCPVAAFHTMEDAIREHGIDGPRFREDMKEAIDRSSPPAHLSRE